MNISSIIDSQIQSSQQAISSQTQLGKDDFLRLLTVQLQYQDPLEPLKNTEFIAQMAQFSSLEQLQNMNQSLGQNLGVETQLHTAFQNNLATSLVGKEVEIPTREIEFDGTAESDLTYRLGEGSRSARLSILDARGSLVREFELDASSRYGTITWDGKSEAGSEVPSGAYLAVIQAEDAGGNLVDSQTLKSARVQAVRYRDGGARILADGREFALEELSGVRERGE